MLKSFDLLREFYLLHASLWPWSKDTGSIDESEPRQLLDLDICSACPILLVKGEELLTLSILILV